MRTKRKALKEAKKSMPTKATVPATPPAGVKNGVAQEDFSRLENEGGLSSKDPAVVAANLKP